MNTAIQTISFPSPRSTDRTGNFVNEAVNLPKMRGRKSASPKWLIRQLSEALDDLADTPCCFWACEGPTRPRYMVTCRRCWAIRQIANVKRTIERAEGEKGDGNG